MTPSKSPESLLRQARRALLGQGDLLTMPLHERLLHSWQRSLAAGLSPLGRLIETDRLPDTELRQELNRQREFIAHAVPVMEFLYEQVQSTESMVILADRQGLLMHVEGDMAFLDRADRVALGPGAIWREEVRGTNAIGTALAEARPIEIHGQEHFLERNGFLTCAAAPIRDPKGQLMGVIDISGDHRNRHPHTHGLVRTAARMVENSLFQATCRGAARLHMHPKIEGVGTLTEGAIALSEDGWIIGGTPAGLEMLGLGASDLGARRIDDVLDVHVGALFDSARRHQQEIRLLHRRRGGALFVRVNAERAPLSPGDQVAGEPKRPAPDALGALDSGDQRVGEALQKLRRVIDKPIPVLLGGESGVGKEMVARAIHHCSARSKQAFIAVNCAALPEQLIESELFGYAPGAFTGARKGGNPGRLREANGGTLFLDEIGDMPLGLQARLLRVLQEREVTPLGSSTPVSVDFSLICASHRNLRVEAEAGRFRLDLYYRINGITIALPALRERTDLETLIGRILRKLSPTREIGLSAEVQSAFARYRWPGNLRQLNNVLTTGVALLDDHEHRIGWSHLPDDLRDELESAHLLDARRTQLKELADEENLRALSFSVIEKTLAACRGNISAASRRLGISRNTLYRRLEEARQQNEQAE